jgi:hypothetical protein
MAESKTSELLKKVNRRIIILFCLALPCTLGCSYFSYNIPECQRAERVCDDARKAEAENKPPAEKEELKNLCRSLTNTCGNEGKRMENSEMPRQKTQPCLGTSTQDEKPYEKNWR